MNAIKYTGGGGVGRSPLLSWSATWPFVRLRVTADTLTMDFGLYGTYAFRRGEVLELRFDSTPVGASLQVVHDVPDFPSYLLFHTRKSEVVVRRDLEHVGFLPLGIPTPPPLPNNAWEADFQRERARSGQPFRRGFLVAAALLWNLPFLYFLVPAMLAASAADDPALFFREARPAGLLAPLLLAGLALAVCFLPPVGRLALKPGRDVAEVRRALLFGAAIAVVLAVGWYGIPQPVAR